MSIHPTAAHGFDRGADDYERGRPGYAREAMAWLAQRLALGREETVVDLGAGTGKLTRDLLGTGARVIAVEPVAAMRLALAERCPEAEVLEGTAERMPFPSGSVEAVTVGQAFHWFDGRRALPEIHRVLDRGGRLALVWNIRDMDQPLQRAIEVIFNRYRGSTPSHSSGGWKEAFTSTDLFRLEATKRAHHVQRLDADGLVARVASTSFIAALPDPEREEVVREVLGLAEGERGQANLEYFTEVLVYRRLSIS